MTDSELRALCNRFLDAIETRDFDTVASLYDPELRFRVNLTGSELSREESLSVLRDGAGRHRRRTYDDRTIDTFDSGFLARYTCTVVAHDGTRTALWACLVALCRGGRIVRMDEYLDSGKFGGARGGARE